MSGVADKAAGGLGTVANVVDLVMAARQGQLGQRMLARQAATQDPDTRMSIERSPFMAGYLGIGGERRPVEAGNLPSPLPRQSIDAPFRANLPPLGPDASSQLAYRRAQTQNLQSQLGYQQLLTRAVAQALGLPMDGEDMGSASDTALGAPGTGTGESAPTPRMGVTDITLGSSGPSVRMGYPTVQQFEYGTDTSGLPPTVKPVTKPPKSLRLPGGTRGPNDQPYKTGDRGPGGERLIIEPSKSSQALRSAAERARIVLPSLEKLVTPRPDGSTALDILPSGQTTTGKYITPLAQRVPGLREFTPTGAIGSKVFGASIPAMSREGNPDATAILSLSGEAGQIVKSLGGEAGVLSNQDWDRFEKNMLPTFAGTREEATERAFNLIDKLQAIISAMDAGADGTNLRDVIMDGVPGDDGTTTTTPVSSRTVSSVPDRAPKSLTRGGGTAVDPAEVKAAKRRLGLQ